MASQSRLQKLTVFLLREGVSADDALRHEPGAKGHRVPVISTQSDVLFVAASPPHSPAWAGYVVPHTPDDLSELLTASSSAVLMVQASDRVLDRKSTRLNSSHL